MNAFLKVTCMGVSIVLSISSFSPLAWAEISEAETSSESPEVSPEVPGDSTVEPVEDDVQNFLNRPFDRDAFKARVVEGARQEALSGIEAFRRKAEVLRETDPGESSKLDAAADALEGEFARTEFDVEITNVDENGEVSYRLTITTHPEPKVASEPKPESDRPVEETKKADPVKSAAAAPSEPSQSGHPIPQLSSEVELERFRLALGEYRENQERKRKSGAGSSRFLRGGYDYQTGTGSSFILQGRGYTNSNHAGIRAGGDMTLRLRPGSDLSEVAPTVKLRGEVQKDALTSYGIDESLGFNTRFLVGGAFDRDQALGLHWQGSVHGGAEAEVDLDRILNLVELTGDARVIIRGLGRAGIGRSNHLLIPFVEGATETRAQVCLDIGKGSRHQGCVDTELDLALGFIQASARMGVGGGYRYRVEETRRDKNTYVFVGVKGDASVRTDISGGNSAAAARAVFEVQHD